MTLLAAGSMAPVLVELGLTVLGLALLTRLAYRVGLSSIPFYLLGGLAFGVGGIVPLSFSEQFVSIGAELGVVLLLFILGLEYTSEELSENLKKGLGMGLIDLTLNSAPGVVAGWLLGFPPVAWVVLGGITAISSSGIIAKLMSDAKGRGRPETKVVLTILVLEDLAMAVFLPVVGVLLSGRGPAEAAVGVGVALAVVGVVLVGALRYGHRLSRWAHHRSSEALVLTAFGLVLVVAGVAEQVKVSAAVGAFLCGVALTGPLARRLRKLLMPLRDLFAALFFLFFGLQTDPTTLPPLLVPAALLATVGIATKVLTGRLAIALKGGDTPTGWRAGTLLIARGEFSIVLAGLGTAVEPDLAPLAAAYVLILGLIGPVASYITGTRRAKPQKVSLSSTGWPVK